MTSTALPLPARPEGEFTVPAAQPLVVRTAPIDLPDWGLATLIDLLPDAEPLAWVRRGDGIVGWGTAARIETRGESRFVEADVAWRALLERAVVRDDVRLPGTGPVAFGS
jgi:menaquinone-specific isochorismate synthase